MPYRSGNIVLCIVGLIVVLAMAIVGVKLSRAMRGATWRRRLIMAGMFTLASLGLGGIAGDLISADSKPADSAAGTTTTSSPTSAATTAPASVPAEYKEDFTGKTLEQTDAWKYLDAVWAKTDVILMGDRGRFPFTKAGKGELLTEIEAITPRLTALAGAKLITPPEAKLLRLLNEMRQTSIHSILPSDDRFNDWEFSKADYEWDRKRFATKVANLKVAINSPDQNPKPIQLMLEMLKSPPQYLDGSPLLIPREDYADRRRAEEEIDKLNVKLSVTIDQLNSLKQPEDYSIIWMEEKFSPLRILWNLTHQLDYGTPDWLFSKETSDKLKSAADCVAELIKDGTLTEAQAKFFLDDIKLYQERIQTQKDKNLQSTDDAEDPAQMAKPDCPEKRLLDNMDRMPPICVLLYEKLTRPYIKDFGEATRQKMEILDSQIAAKWSTIKQSLRPEELAQAEKLADNFIATMMNYKTDGNYVVDDYIRALAAQRNIQDFLTDLRLQLNAGKYDEPSTVEYINSCGPEDFSGARCVIPVLDNSNFTPYDAIMADKSLLSELAAQKMIAPAAYEKIAPLLLQALEFGRYETYYPYVSPKEKDLRGLLEPVLAASEVKGTELEQTAQWKRLTSAWRDAEIICSGATGNEAYFPLGGKLLQGRLLLAKHEVEILKQAKMLSENEAALLCDSLEWLADSSGGRWIDYSLAMTSSCYYGATSSGFYDSKGILEKTNSLLKDFVSVGKIKPAVAEKILRSTDADWLTYAEYEYKTEKKQEIWNSIAKSADEIREAINPDESEIAQSADWKIVSANIQKWLAIAKTGNTTFAQRAEIMRSVGEIFDATERLAIRPEDMAYLRSYILVPLARVAMRGNASDSNSDTYKYPCSHEGGNQFKYVNSAMIINGLIDFIEDKPYTRLSDTYSNELKKCRHPEIVAMHIDILKQFEQMLKSPDFYKHDTLKASDADISTTQKKLRESIALLKEELSSEMKAKIDPENSTDAQTQPASAPAASQPTPQP